MIAECSVYFVISRLYVVYKDDDNDDDFLMFSDRSNTRGHCYELFMSDSNATTH